MLGEYGVETRLEVGPLSCDAAPRFGRSRQPNTRRSARATTAAAPPARERLSHTSDPAPKSLKDRAAEQQRR
jgi:hypothetical protein